MTSLSNGEDGQSHRPPANDSSHITPPPLPWRPQRSVSLQHSEAHSPPSDTAPAHLQSASAASPVRKVQFSDDLEIFDVEKLYFCDLRGNTRDLSETCSDPDWCSIGVARANKLVAFAEGFLLRKYLCTWWAATEFSVDFSQNGDNAQHDRRTSTDLTDESATHDAHQVCAEAHEQVSAHVADAAADADRNGKEEDAAPNGAANGAGRAAGQASRAPPNLSVRVPPDSACSRRTNTAVAMPYYLTNPLHSDTSPFLPSLPNLLDMHNDIWRRTASNDDDDEWSDWDSTSDCSSVRQSAEFVRL